MKRQIELTEAVASPYENYLQAPKAEVESGQVLGPHSPVTPRTLSPLSFVFK